jgi:hypothetical protein
MRFVDVTCTFYETNVVKEGETMGRLVRNARDVLRCAIITIRLSPYDPTGLLSLF